MNQQHIETPVAYRIHYSADGSLCQTYQAHNAIDTYRAIDPSATVTPLYERPRCPMTDQVNEAVAWMIGNPDGTVNPIGAIYHHRENCQQHIDGYGGKLAASIIPLYTHPARGVVSDAMVDLAMDADALEYGASIPASRVRRILEAAALQAAALPAVPEGESVTLTVAQIADLARFAGLTLAQPPQPTADELEAQITVCECPDTGVLLDGEDADPGLVAHYTHTAYYSEYPGEGCIGLGPELVATPKDQPAQGEG